MSDQNKRPCWGAQQASIQNWQQREKDKAKAHFGLLDWQNLSENTFSSSSSRCLSIFSSNSSVTWQTSTSYPKNLPSLCTSYSNSHGMSMGEVNTVNTTLAQEMSRLGMGIYAPVNMTIKALSIVNYKK